MSKAALMVAARETSRRRAALQRPSTTIDIYWVSDDGGTQVRTTIRTTILSRADCFSLWRRIDSSAAVYSSAAFALSAL
jgi:hypothetical protein